VPELPEVEVVRSSLEPLLVGRRITGVQLRCASLRRPVDPALPRLLAGRSITATRRRSKYLVLDLDQGPSCILHFGMSGTLIHNPGGLESPARHDHLLFELDDGAVLSFNDPRRFGLVVMDDYDSCSLFAELGPEPLQADRFTGAYLAGFKTRSRRTIKDVLMDQRVVAGLGNIYVNEILFDCGVRPRRRMPRVSRAECALLVESSRRILTEAIEHRGSTVSDFLDGIGRRGGYQWRHQVYDKVGEPCGHCGSVIKLVSVGGRSSFYCPSCQD
jgi:formamidopyrimidine-DNA glycosylase